MKSLVVRALLLVENNGYPFDVRVRREALALHEAGCEVSVIAPRAKGQPWSDVVDGVHVFRYPAPPGASGVLSYAFEFGYSTFAMLCLALWVALRRGVDVVHAANPPDTLFAVALVLKCLGARFVFDHHDLSPETYLSRFPRAGRNLLYRALRWLERCTFATADIVISTNESYRQVAIERGGMAPDKVFVVRNGPPLSYQPVEPDPALANRAKFLIGYIGTMGPQDGVDYLLRAIRKLVTEVDRRDFLAVVIGTGDAEPDLRALARQLDIEPYVWFTGRIPDKQVKAILSSVHVCVQPDPSSPLNDKSTMNKMMEYMALGKPTVAFDLHETRISAADAAVYVGGNDELEFARQISALFEDPARRERMGEIGRKRVRSQLAWEFSKPELVRAYSDGLGLPLRAVAPAASTVVPSSAAPRDRNSRGGDVKGIRPLRVLFVCHSASRNGATILLLQLIQWLKRQGGWEIHVLIHGDGALAKDFAAVATTTLWRDPSTALDALFRSKGGALRRFVEFVVGRAQLPARRFDLIYANTVAVLPSVRLLARRDCPTLWHIHELEYAVRMLASETEWRDVAATATRFIAVSQAVSRMLQETFGILARSIDVAAGFSPLRAAPPEERRRRRSEVLARLGWPEDAFVVGGCGIQGWRKGTDLFLQLARKVIRRAEMRDIRFLWVGGVQGSREWLEFHHDLRKLGLEERVQLVADSADVADHYGAMSAFALTSREDPLPLVALEAAEYHVPVLCFEGAGGAVDFVSPDAGISVPYLDIDRFADELLGLHDHADRRERLSQLAHEKARATYCVEVQGPKIVETMRACIADSPPWRGHTDPQGARRAGFQEAL